MGDILPLKKYGMFWEFMSPYAAATGRHSRKNDIKAESWKISQS